MYKFWYDFLKQKCEEIKVIYMDTNSFIFEVTNQNFKDTMFENNEYFDLSNYPKERKYYDSTNKKVLGKMKDEYPGKNINKVIALKSKSYIVITADNKEECRHKGHNYKFTANEYRDALFNNAILSHPLRKIISIRHKLYTKENNKKTLPCIDEKRYLQADKINTLALGHKNTFKK